ncbi:MAG: sugar transferase [Bacteroidota bacterium]
MAYPPMDATATLGPPALDAVTVTRRAERVSEPVASSALVGVPVVRPAGARTQVVATTDRAVIEALPAGTEAIVNGARLNDVRYLNKFFEAVNAALPTGGTFAGCVQTSELRKRAVFGAHPRWIAWLVYAVEFLFTRAFPKLKPTQRLYFALTKGRGRAFSKAEVLGRLVSCGFEIVEHYDSDDGLFRFVVRKERAPAFDENPSYGPVFKMKRVGRGGEPVHVYKLRTMHPYAEYLQAYLYATNSLDEKGKFRDDFRITTWGRTFRRLWIDELPMLLNWLRGDLRLVGVRPISEHYLSLYPEALAAQRCRHKPGLVPPFYADLPNGFEEVLDSEAAYLEAYERAPVRTNVRYFGRAMYNIFVKRARSQ